MNPLPDLLAWLRQEPQWASLLEPWQELTAATAPAAPPVSLELLWWLAGLAGFPETLQADLRRWTAESEALALRQQIELALQAEPEPPMDWAWRILRYLPVWLAGKPLPYPAYYSLRRLHFVTQRATTRLLTCLHQALLPPQIPAFPRQNSCGLTLEAAQALSQQVEKNSYAVLPDALPARLLAKIVAFAQKTPCYPSLPDRDHRDPLTGEYTLPRLRFDPSAPLAHRYDFHFAELWNCQAIQAVAAEPFWFWLAEQVLGSQASLIQAYLWWSAACEGPQSRYTGQVFHVDLDRFHFVNLFFYLTDVSHQSGPQVYVTGTHKHLPAHLSRDQRWSDAELAAAFAPERFATLTGPAGTGILANTLALHKGRPLQTGCRLTLQLEFASSTLGEPAASIPPPDKIHADLQAQLLQQPQRYPSLQAWCSPHK